MEPPRARNLRVGSFPVKPPELGGGHEENAITIVAAVAENSPGVFNEEVVRIGRIARGI